MGDAASIARQLQKEIIDQSVAWPKSLASVAGAVPTTPADQRARAELARRLLPPSLVQALAGPSGPESIRLPLKLDIVRNATSRWTTCIRCADNFRYDTRSGLYTCAGMEHTLLHEEMLHGGIAEDAEVAAFPWLLFSFIPTRVNAPAYVISAQQANGYLVGQEPLFVFDSLARLFDFGVCVIPTNTPIAPRNQSALGEFDADVARGGPRQYKAAIEYRVNMAYIYSRWLLPLWDLETLGVPDDTLTSLPAGTQWPVGDVISDRELERDYSRGSAGSGLLPPTWYSQTSTGLGDDIEEDEDNDAAHRGTGAVAGRGLSDRLAGSFRFVPFSVYARSPVFLEAARRMVQWKPVATHAPGY